MPGINTALYVENWRKSFSAIKCLQHSQLQLATSHHQKLIFFFANEKVSLCFSQEFTEWSGIRLQRNSITSMPVLSVPCWDIAEHGDRSMSKDWKDASAKTNNFYWLLCIYYATTVWNSGFIHDSQLFSKSSSFGEKPVTSIKWTSSAFHKVVRWHFWGVVDKKYDEISVKLLQYSAYEKLLKSVDFRLSYTKIMGRRSFFLRHNV